MFQKIKGDITKTEADVIVNAANTEMIQGGGVALAIAKAAGEEFEKENKSIKFIPLGDFVTTAAGKLKAQKIIHIPTIDYKNKGKKITYEQLVEVWNRVLEYCSNHGLKKIAVPLLGAGVVGLDKERVEDIISQGAKNFPDLKILLVDFNL